MITTYPKELRMNLYSQKEFAKMDSTERRCFQSWCRLNYNLSSYLMSKVSLGIIIIISSSAVIVSVCSISFLISFTNFFIDMLKSDTKD